MRHLEILVGLCRAGPVVRGGGPAATVSASDATPPICACIFLSDLVTHLYLGPIAIYVCFIGLFRALVT
jgi:hypothetical protein